MGYISQQDYGEIVDSVIKFLRGYDHTAAALIKEKMEKAAQLEQYERAIVYRDQLQMLKELKLK